MYFLQCRKIDSKSRSSLQIDYREPELVGTHWTGKLIINPLSSRRLSWDIVGYQPRITYEKSAHAVIYFVVCCTPIFQLYDQGRGADARPPAPYMVWSSF